jgi:hypothetical protein
MIAGVEEGDGKDIGIQYIRNKKLYIYGKWFYVQGPPLY